MQLTKPAPWQLRGAVFAADPGVLRTARWRCITKVHGWCCAAAPSGRGFGWSSLPALRVVPGVTPLASRRPRVAPPCLKRPCSHQGTQGTRPGSGHLLVGRCRRLPKPRVRTGPARRIFVPSTMVACRSPTRTSASSIGACGSPYAGVVAWVLEAQPPSTSAAAQGALHSTESWSVEQRVAVDEAGHQHSVPKPRN
jgi:hypothetical protein